MVAMGNPIGGAKHKSMAAHEAEAKVMAASAANRAQKMTEKMTDALVVIASWRCQTFHNADGAECYRHGRTENARYTADRCCAPCIAHNALFGVSAADDEISYQVPYTEQPLGRSSSLPRKPRPTDDVVSKPKRKYADTFSAVTVLKKMFFSKAE